ncbi:MAG: DUF92 domain-containing protein, partial [Candidatus Thorarchaeota archaeon]
PVAIDIFTLMQAVFVCAILGAFSFKLNFVSFSGLIAAFFIGVLIFVLPPEGWKWFLIILIFHTVAAQFTKYKYEIKRRKGFAQEKGGARAWPNILANGAIATIFAIAGGFSSLGVFIYGFIGAVSTATADTLATEIGLLNKDQPRLIVNLRKKVPAGTSGGISPLGEIGTLFGGLIIGICVLLLKIGNHSNETILLAAIISGLIGSTFDSFIGATIQGIFKCKICENITENKKHCGNQTIQIRGSRFIDNNMVNLMATTVGAVIGVIIFFIFS